MRLEREANVTLRAYGRTAAMALVALVWLACWCAQAPAQDQGGPSDGTSKTASEAKPAVDMSQTAK